MGLNKTHNWFNAIKKYVLIQKNNHIIQKHYVNMKNDFKQYAFVQNVAAKEHLFKITDGFLSHLPRNDEIKGVRVTANNLYDPIKEMEMVDELIKLNIVDN